MPQSKTMVLCSGCDRWKNLAAHGLCGACYARYWRGVVCHAPNPIPEIERRLVLYTERASRGEPLFDREQS